MSKFFKNQNRNASQKQEKYVPQYKQMNLEPEMKNFPRNHNIPNVGATQAWTHDDSEENGLDPNHPMIDNNEYISIPGLEEVTHQPTPKKLNDSYLVFIENDLVGQGSLEEVESIVSQLIFGEFKNYDVVPQEYISVFKKMKIKTGVFLE